MANTEKVLWIIDSHAHYFHNSFGNSFRFLNITPDSYSVDEGTREDVLYHLKQNRILCSIEPGISVDSCEQILNQYNEQPIRIFPSVGIHPTRAINEKWSRRKLLKQHLQHPAVIAVGETGLDYHYPRKEQHRFYQALWFLYQLDLSYKAKLPVILHVRQADKTALRILKYHPAKKYGGVIHCFNRDWSTARAYLDLGYHIGIGGTLLQKNERAQALRETVKNAPLSRIIVETDSPFILPDCKEAIPSKVLRRTRNTSLILPRVIEEIALIKKLPIHYVASTVLQNTIDLFSLPILPLEQSTP